MRKLYILTPLEDSFACNFNILIDGHPRVMGIKEILHEWTKFRINCIRRRTQYDINKKSEKRHLLLGLEKILLDIDKAIKIIRETEKEKEVITNLMKGFKIDEVQAEYVAEIKLRNLNKEYILNRTKEIDAINKELKNLNELLKDEKKIKKLIALELENVSKKYGQARKIKIIAEEKIETVSKEDFIEDYNLKIFLTKQQYIKKISLVSLRAYSIQELKEGDEIVQEIETTNKSELLLFSDKQNVYKIKAYELEDTKASSLGDFIPNILELEEDENIIFVTAANDKYEGDLLFAFENGKLVKVPLRFYETKQNRKKLINCFYGRSKCIAILHIIEDIDILLMRNDKKAALINTSLVLKGKSKKAAGNQAIKLTKKTCLESVLLPEDFSDKNIEEYRATSIPAKAVSTYTQIELNL